MTSDLGPSSSDLGWLEHAARVLANLGFELIEPDRANGEETSHLLAALRSAPTLRHFDPDGIDYWVADGAKGRAARLDRETRLPVVGDFAWGRITITDRLGVHNEFLSFGGALRASAAQDATVLVDFSSNAPILRWSGHSQQTDPMAAEVGAFFARLKVPIDFVPGAEALIAKAAPRTLYCAFIQFVRERLSQARGMRDANRSLAVWSSREGQRMEATSADHWNAAADMRRTLAAIEATARE